jgi:hypothetical protein
VQAREELPLSEPEPEPAMEPVAEAPASPDDWFAVPSDREQDTQPAEASHETTFDLDAAFQSVLPNNEANEEDVFTSASAVADLEEAPVTSESSWETSAASIDVWAVEASVQPVEEESVDDAFETADNVDDAFAQLDRLTADLDAQAAGSAMLLPDEEYVAEEQSEEVRAAIARTPDMGVPAVEATPVAFVTETMAELYLQQGFRDEALAVYRQLLVMNPDDAILAARVQALEETAASAGSSSYQSPQSYVPAQPRADSAGQSMRAFLGVFARRRAPMRRRDAVRPEQAPAAEPESRLSALFGTTNGSDEGAAAALAGAFSQPNADLPGRPTRAAAAELSLGDVFGGGVATSNQRAATFDEFFSAGNADHAPRSPLDEEGSDMEQFTAWLEGLKKK